MHIKSFLSYIQQAAESIDKEKHSELYTKVSMLAKTVGDFIERKTAQKTGAVGISEKCKEARKKFAMELSSVHKEMKEANDSALSDAVEHIDLAIQFMQKMEDLRGLN
ncbi:unnamed protein product [Litomosoides sigmodontis]|uniref:BAR domain-containing protein n=1 Tax=Litomosoides sigmodontis TaxID=42156 RepID=A0A3P6SRQ7_LITSI|nr:unnamed protein product [Litomosoides sigmodontis]